MELQKFLKWALIESTEERVNLDHASALISAFYEFFYKFYTASSN